MEMKRFQIGSSTAMSIPTKIAALVFGLVLFLPIFALLLIAGIVASAVFGVLIIIGIVNTKIRSLRGKDLDGRRNVRVKR